jgi:hypothetical protein
MTRSGNTNVPCEPFCWGHVRVAGPKIPKMVRHFKEREQIGSWPRKKGKGKAQNSGAYDDSYIIDDENDQLSANWERA